MPRHPADTERIFIAAVMQYLRERYNPDDPFSINPDGIANRRLIEAIAAGVSAVHDASD